MAEALAIVPLVLQAVQLAGQLGSHIRAYRHAGDHILALANEAADFAVLLDNISSMGGKLPSGPFERVLERAERQLRTLEAYVAYLTDTTGTTSRGYDRLRWVRLRKQGTTLKTELRALRETIVSLLVVENIVMANKIDVAVEALNIQRSDRQGEQLNSMRLISTELHQQEQRLNTLTSRLDTLTDLQQSKTEALQLPPATNVPKGSDLIPFRAQVDEYSESPSLDIGGGMDSILEICTDPSVRHFKLSVASFNGSCSNYCSCACHKATRLRTSNALRALIGGLFLGYAGKPSGKPHCDERKCQSDSSFTLRIAYYFPRWLVLRRAIELRLAFLGNTGPEATLRICNVVGFDSDVLSAATYGDMTLMKTLFLHRLASPFDVSLEGDSPLIWATEHNQGTMCRFLLHSGADPHHVNMDGYSAIDVAWTKILGKTSTDESLFRTIYEDGTDFANWQFTTIHKIVLGLIDADLESRLLESSAQVNVKDSKGRAPLSWAVQRGDLNAARILLRHGADPNLLDNTGRGLYRWAVLCPDPRCVELLIDSGANVNHPDVYGNTPLHWACWFQSDYRHAEALVRAGANKQSRSYEGNKPTPIHLAFWHGHDKTAAMLLDAGGCIPDSERNALLFAAIQEDMRETIQRMVRDMDGSTLTTDDEGNSVLHAAAFSNLRVMNVIGSMSNLKASVWDENEDGFTALDLLDLREDPSDGFAEAFRSFFGAPKQSKDMVSGGAI